jgi:paraquat-inducible protein A
MPTRALIACYDCDLLQRETALPPGGVARCGRCGAQLYRDHPHGLDRSLACTLGADVCLALANMFPLVGLEASGNLVQTTLLGAVRALYAQGMWVVAGLVLLTTLVAPLTELAAMTCLLVPLRFNRVPRYMPLALRILNLARTWSMVEVFMLGMLVALAKLARVASVIPGVALTSFGVLMLLLAAARAGFDPHALWAKAGAVR